MSDPIAFLPQKPPAVYLDEVLELAPQERAVGATTFPAGHRIFEGHLPGEPLVPGVILIEALAQLSGIVLIPAEGRPVRGYLGEVAQMRFRRLIRPGERILLRAELERRFGRAARFRVSAEVDGVEAASGTITVASAD